MRINDRFLSRAFWIFAFILLVVPAELRAETVVAHETEKYFYKDGSVQKFEGQYEYTYFVDPEKPEIVRTRVYDYQSQKITPDETVYQVQKELISDPSLAGRHGMAPVIRAVGRPGSDILEILVIDGDAVHIVKSTSNEIVLAHAKRLK